MESFRDSVLIGEINFHSKLAHRGAELLQNASGSSDKIEIWSSIQLILIAIGNISKILWPTKKTYKDRGEKLRKLLKVDDNSILRSRKFRNQFEHYDEIIDEFFRNQTSVNYVDFAMNPSISSLGVSKCHRGYNSFNNTIVVLGQILDLSAVLKAIEELEDKCSPYVI